VSKKNVLNPKKFPAFIKKLKEGFNVSSGLLSSAQ